MATKVNILIIGGSFAGILTAHALLKAIPTAKITIINPSKNFYFNIASPRILAKPGAIPTSDYLLSIKSLFVEYSSESFAFVEGKVISIEVAEKFVTLEERTVVHWDYLIIASGSTTSSTIGRESDIATWKSPKSGNIEYLIKTTQERIASAKSVVIGGAGPVGIEFAGELAETLTSDKENRTITLISATNRLLPNVREAVGIHAEQILRGKNVEILKGSRVVSAVRNGEMREWTVTLESGQELLADLYISTTGVRPDNQYIPADFLSSDGWMVVDEHLQVKNSNPAYNDKGSSKLPIFALGDVTIHEPRIVRNIKDQVPILVANLKADIEGVHDSSRPTYAPSPINSIMIPIGQRDGTGLFFGIVPWGSLVWMVKGRNYLVPWVRGFLSG